MLHISSFPTPTHVDNSVIFTTNKLRLAAGIDTNLRATFGEISISNLFVLAIIQMVLFLATRVYLLRNTD